MKINQEIKINFKKFMILILDFLKLNWFQISLLFVIMFIGNKIVDEIHSIDFQLQCECDCRQW